MWTLELSVDYYKELRKWNAVYKWEIFKKKKGIQMGQYIGSWDVRTVLAFRKSTSDGPALGPRGLWMDADAGIGYISVSPLLCI